MARTTDSMTEPPTVKIYPILTKRGILRYKDIETEQFVSKQKARRHFKKYSKELAERTEEFKKIEVSRAARPPRIVPLKRTKELRGIDPADKHTVITFYTEIEAISDASQTRWFTSDWKYAFKTDRHLSLEDAKNFVKENWEEIYNNMTYDIVSKSTITNIRVTRMSLRDYYNRP